MCRKYLPLAVVLLLAFSASSWAQAAPSAGPIASGQPATVPQPAPTSPTLDDIAARLLQLSTALSTEADAQSTELAELSSLLEESRNALLNSQASLDKAAAELQRRNLELWLWRGAAAVGIAVGIAGLIWGATR